MTVTVLDGVLIAVTLISALLAMYRGFVREVLSIAAWVIAAIAAWLLYAHLTPYVLRYVHKELLAIGLAAAAIFLVTLIIVSFITMKFSDFVIDSRIGFIDRSLGFVFGAARGILLVVVAVLFFNWLVTAEHRPTWVAHARSYPFLTNAGDRLVAVLPQDPEKAFRSALQRADVNVALPGVPAGQAPAPAADYGNHERQGLDQLIQSTGTPPAAAPAASPGPVVPAVPAAVPAASPPVR